MIRSQCHSIHLPSLKIIFGKSSLLVKFLSWNWLRFRRLPHEYSLLCSRSSYISGWCSLGFFILLVLGEQYSSCSSTVCNFINIVPTVSLAHLFMSLKTSFFNYCSVSSWTTDRRRFSSFLSLEMLCSVTDYTMLPTSSLKSINFLKNWDNEIKSSEILPYRISKKYVWSYYSVWSSPLWFRQTSFY